MKFVVGFLIYAAVTVPLCLLGHAFVPANWHMLWGYWAFSIGFWASNLEKQGAA